MCSVDINIDCRNEMKITIKSTYYTLNLKNVP